MARRVSPAYSAHGLSNNLGEKITVRIHPIVKNQLLYFIILFILLLMLFLFLIMSIHHDGNRTVIQQFYLHIGTKFACSNWLSESIG